MHDPSSLTTGGASTSSVRLAGGFFPPFSPQHTGLKRAVLQTELQGTAWRSVFFLVLRAAVCLRRTSLTFLAVQLGLCFRFGS